MVKPGGTGRPMFAISARFAPLPPRRFFISLLPSDLPPPKKYTRLPGLLALTEVFTLTASAANAVLRPFLCPFLPFLPFLRAVADFLSFWTRSFDFDLLVLLRLGMGAYLPWFVGLGNSDFGRFFCVNLKALGRWP